MGITVGDNFDHKSKKPLDGRVQYATLAAMKAVSDANIYEGCTAFCVETGKEYRFLSSNTVNENTGKWREHEGQTYTAGNNIEISQNNEISATDTTYSAGDGIVIDSENDNEISADIMPSSDMEEVAYPLPGVRKQGIVYSTKEQVVGEWIDGKPLYQKTIDCTSYTLTDNGSTEIPTGLTTIEELVDIRGLAYHTSDKYYRTLPHVQDNNPDFNSSSISFFSASSGPSNKGKIIIWTRKNTYASYWQIRYITLQYTKTTS